MTDIREHLKEIIGLVVLMEGDHKTFHGATYDDFMKNTAGEVYKRIAAIEAILGTPMKTEPVDLLALAENIVTSWCGLPYENAIERYHILISKIHEALKTAAGVNGKEKNPS